MHRIGLSSCLLLVLAGLPVGNCALAQNSLDQTVKRLIHEVAIPAVNPGPYERKDGKQAQIFRELAGLGMPAVPYIIRYMDDRRPLPYRLIELENRSADRFEAIRFYAPRQVVDGLAAVLNHLTGKDFGEIYNGGTDEGRAATIAGWRAWCASEWPDKKDICAGPTQP